MKCNSEGCVKQKAPGRRICYSCVSKRYKEKHPKRYCYNTLKNNSRRRGKEFTLTFEQFLEFCIETDYFYKKGRSKKSYHIDRKNEMEGYSIDNIQVLTNTENVRKYLKWVSRDEDGDNFRSSKQKDIEDSSDVPF